MNKKLLLVEDDKDLAESLQEYLLTEGFEVFLAHSCREAQQHGPMADDVVILDWMLPDGAGIDVLRAWREQGVQTPVIMLTARVELVDRVVGLELGANDYITKPFEPRELLARIRVQLRGHAKGEAVETNLRCGELFMNTSTREVRFSDAVLELSRQEYALLRLLMENPNRVYSREEILNQAWGYDSFPTTRTVDTHILQLRQKTVSHLIETVRGIGYRLRCPEDLAKS